MEIKNYNSKVLWIKELSQNVRLVGMTREEGFEFFPGQTIALNIENTNLKRNYSSCSSPKDKSHIEICVKRVKDGPGSGYVFSLKEGDIVKYMGPIGPKYFDSNHDKDIALIGNGTGVAPLRCLIHELLENGFRNKLILFAAYREEDSLLFEDEFKSLKEKYNNFEYYLKLTKPKDEKDQGDVAEIVKDKIEMYKECSFFISGVSAMVDEVKKILIDKKIPEERILSKGFG